MTRDELLSIEQVSDWLQVPVATLRTWRTRGAPGGSLPVIKVGKHLRYRARDVETWLASNTSDRTKPPPLRVSQRRTA